MARAAWQGIAMWGAGAVVTVSLSSAVVLTTTAAVTDPVRTVELAGTDAAFDGIPVPTTSPTDVPLPSGSGTPATSTPAPTGAPADPVSSTPPRPSTGSGSTSSTDDAIGDDRATTDDPGATVPDDTTTRSESPSPSPSPSDEPPPTTTGTTDTSRSATSIGGSARFRFTDTGIEIEFATPAQGFRVEVERDAPFDVRVTFVSASHESRIDAELEDGQPRVRVREEDRD